MEEIDRLRLWQEAFEARELRDMLDEHANLIYAAKVGDALMMDSYLKLVRLCAVKRAYEVPPEYSGVLTIAQRVLWSPTDTEIARVLVAVTEACPSEQTLYADLVGAIGKIVSTARPHIYRSLKVILKSPPGRGGFVLGIRLR